MLTLPELISSETPSSDRPIFTETPALALPASAVSLILPTWNFERTAFFAVTTFNDNAHFLGAKFNNDLVLESARIYSMQLDNATFGKNSKISLKDADFTRLVVPWSTIKDRLEFNGAAYLALVKNYKNLEWFDDADNCYYEYRQISLANEPWGWAKLADVITWLSCGYGVRVSYIAFWCLLTSPLLWCCLLGYQRNEEVRTDRNEYFGQCNRYPETTCIPCRRHVL